MYFIKVNIFFRDLELLEASKVACMRNFANKTSVYLLIVFKKCI